MALKDLVADSDQITEEVIESIIAEYVRYDPKRHEIVLTPSGIALENDAKVLVILVAIVGWKYILEEAPSVDTKPAALEVLTGITGGTLRPVLKKLKDAHLLAVSNGSYSVRAGNLDAIRRAIAGTSAIVPRKSGARSRKKSAKPQNGEIHSTKEPTEDLTGATGKTRRRTVVPIRASLTRLFDAGFFSEERSLGDVVARMHEMAIIAKSTSLSGPMADLVREEKLVRKKKMKGAKEIWTYRAVQYAR